MAKGLICNRCHRCFNPLTVEGEFMHFSNPTIQTSEDYAANMRGRYFDPVEGYDGVIDLCPDCTPKFFDYMERKIGDSD